MYSLKYRIAATFFLLELIILSFVIWQVLSASIESNYTQIKNTQENTLKLVEQSARLALFTEEFDIVQLRMETLIENPNVLKALVVDHRNIIIASANLEDLGHEPPVATDSEDTYWREKVIGREDNKLGRLMVQYSTRLLDEIYFDTLKRGVIIAAIGLVFIASVSLTLGTILTRKISRVFKATDGVMRGDFSIRSGLQGKDEVARLGIALDGMISHVADERERMSELNRELEQRVAERTKHLEMANNEIQSFSYSVSHDLRAPVRRIGNYADIFLEDYQENIDDEGKHVIERIKSNSVEMMNLIDSLMMLSKITHQEIVPVEVNLSEIFKSVLDELVENNPQRKVKVSIQPDLFVHADKALMGRVVENLAGNAWKYTGKTEHASIVIGREVEENVFYVRDNGAGFNQEYADKLFIPFERLHHDSEFQGSGIGLSTVHRIIERHHGKIWASSEPDKQTTFFFSLPG